MLSFLLILATQFYAFPGTPRTEYNPTCMCCTESSHDAGTIAFTKHWKIVLVSNQSYLGRIVIVSNRHFATYEEMTDEEASEYRDILRQLLPALQKTFNVTHFNVAYLMNGAYNAEKPEPSFKNGKPNPHFHWHIIPRYDGPRTFCGEHFEDPLFGSPADLLSKQCMNDDFRQKAIAEIRKRLDVAYYYDLTI